MLETESRTYIPALPLLLDDLKQVPSLLKLSFLILKVRQLY